MSFGALIPAIASIPALASYPFTVTFLLLSLASLARWHIADPGGAMAATLGFSALTEGWASDISLPLWMTGALILVPLGILALAELTSERSPDAQALLSDANRLIKPGASALVQYGLVDGQAAAIAGLLAAALPRDLVAALSEGTAVASLSAAQPDPAAGLVWLVHILAIGWAGLAAAAVWVLTSLRAAILAALMEIDDDDSLGLLKLFTLAEGAWAATTVLVIIALPLLALALAGLTALGLFLVQKWVERRDARSKVPCPSCAAPIYPTALFCPGCRQPNPAPLGVGLFGQATGRPAGDLTAHRLNLLARRRCPSCAARLRERAAQQRCPDCATVTFADIADANRYLRAVDARLPRTLGICFLLGLVPVVGVVPGVIFYRLSLVASLRGYVPRHIGCLTRWALRVAGAFLLMLQAFPVVGSITLPLLCLMSYSAYRGVLSRTMQQALPAAAPAPPAGPVAALAPAPALAAAAGCPRCGAAITPPARFCTSCGGALGS